MRPVLLSFTPPPTKQALIRVPFSPPPFLPSTGALLRFPLFPPLSTRAPLFPTFFPPRNSPPLTGVSVFHPCFSWLPIPPPLNGKISVLHENAEPLLLIAELRGPSSSNTVSEGWSPRFLLFLVFFFFSIFTLLKKSFFAWPRAIRGPIVPQRPKLLPAIFAFLLLIYVSFNYLIFTNLCAFLFFSFYLWFFFIPSPLSAPPVPKVLPTSLEKNYLFLFPSL